MDNEINWCGPVEISVKKLQKMANPFRACVWRELSKPITRKEIQSALDRNDLRPFISFDDAVNNPEPDDELTEDYHRREHAARIAYLVKNGWDDPIDIDVGVPAAPGYRAVWPICDGNHRFAAAIFKKSKTILASCSGQISYLETLLTKPRKPCIV